MVKTYKITKKSVENMNGLPSAKYEQTLIHQTTLKRKC